MEEGDETKDGVEVAGGPLVYPGEAVSHGQSDEAQAVGQAAEDEEGDLPEEESQRDQLQGGPGLLLPQREAEVEGAGDAGVQPDEVGGEADEVSDDRLAAGRAGLVEESDVVPGQVDAGDPAQGQQD